MPQQRVPARLLMPRSPAPRPPAPSPPAGDGLRRRTHWPLWMMVGAAFCGLAAMTQPRRGAGAEVLRLAQAAGAAALLALYLALEFFPGLPMVQVGAGMVWKGRASEGCVVRGAPSTCRKARARTADASRSHLLALPAPALSPPAPQAVILVSALLAALFLVLLQLPVPGGVVLMPALALAWGAGLPLALGAAALSELPPLPEAAERLLPDSERELDEERYDAVRCVPGQGPSFDARPRRLCDDGHAAPRRLHCRLGRLRPGWSA